MVRCGGREAEASQGEAQAADGTWSGERVAALIEGEVCVYGHDDRGRPVEYVESRTSAYEQRTRALDGRAPVESLLDAIQLVQAIDDIDDLEARAMMIASVGLGCVQWWMAEDALLGAGIRPKRSGRKVWERGMQLIVKGERSRRRQLTRVRASNGMSDNPVCWRCLKVDVKLIGDECGCILLRGRPGPKKGKTARKETETMTLEELAATQSEPDDYAQWNRQIPGGSYYIEVFSPGGRDPSERIDAGRDHDQRRGWA